MRTQLLRQASGWWTGLRYALAAAALPGSAWGAGPNSEIHVGRILLKPSAFFETIGVVRSATLPDTVATDFGTIPLAQTPSDSLASLRHSRLMLHGETRIGAGTLVGYVETDFLSPPGRAPWRFRQAWGEYRQGKWRVLAGQAWSLLRANQTGISSEQNLIDIDVIDPAYHVGLLGDRKRQVRLVRDLAQGWLMAVSYEERGQVIGKVVRDRKRLHLEGVGLAGRNAQWGGAIAAVVHAGEKVSVLSQQFVTRGAAPEAVGGLPHGVRAFATIEGIEARLPHGVGVFAYGGLVYGGRSAGNRVVREWTIGATQKLFTKPGYGSAMLAGHYSHVARGTWAGPQGQMGYLMVSCRYTWPVRN